MKKEDAKETNDEMKNEDHLSGKKSEIIKDDGELGEKIITDEDGEFNDDDFTDDDEDEGYYFNGDEDGEFNDDDFTDDEVDNVIKGTDEKIGSAVELKKIEPDIRFKGNQPQKKFKELYKESRKNEKKNKKIKIKDVAVNFFSKKNFIKIAYGVISALDFVLNAVIVLAVVLTVLFSIKFLYEEKWIMALVSGAVSIIVAYINEKIK